jgi:hypothetical protein
MKYESACERDFFSVSSLLAALDKVIYLHICVCPACTHTHTLRVEFFSETRSAPCASVARKSPLLLLFITCVAGFNDTQKYLSHRCRRQFLNEFPADCMEKHTMNPVCFENFTPIWWLSWRAVHVSRVIGHQANTNAIVAITRVLYF